MAATRPTPTPEARLSAQLRRERLARVRAEGRAEGMEAALKLLLPTRAWARLRKLAEAASAEAVVRKAPARRARTRAAAAPAPKPAPMPAARTRKAASAHATPLPQRARQRQRPAPRVRKAPATPRALTGPLGELLSGASATALEAALVQVRASPERSAAEQSAAAEVLQRMGPFLEGAARAKARQYPHLEVAELVQVSNEAILRSLRGFTPGRAGPGRTLFPAYALRAARQAMSKLARERQGPVQLTDWGLKVRSRARKRARAEGTSLREALVAEGAAPESLPSLERGHVIVHDVPLAEVDVDAYQRHDTEGSSKQARPALLEAVLSQHAAAEASREHLALGEIAMAALQRLPEAERAAVAGPLGLEGPATPLPVLARRLGLPLAQVQALQERGLAALRAALAEEA